MRPDMHEVIIERPRRRPWKEGYPRQRHAREEDPPLREGMGRGYRQKYLNENLEPLRRFLASRVGRPWSRVRSEISEHLRVASAVQKHVVDHLPDLVVLHAWEEDGVVRGTDRWGRLHRLRANGRAVLWVDARTGILRRLPPSPRPLAKRLARPCPDVRRLADGTELRRFRGVWHLVTIVKREPDDYPGSSRGKKPQPGPFDALARMPVPSWPRRDDHELADLWASGRYVRAARPLTKRERIAWLG